MDPFMMQMKGRLYLTALETGMLSGLLQLGCFVGSLFAGKFP